MKRKPSKARAQRITEMLSENADFSGSSVSSASKVEGSTLNNNENLSSSPNRPKDNRERFASNLTRKPSYVILFETEQEANAPYLSYLSLEQAQSTRHLVTEPHGLSRELVPCLQPLWFCLHLPATAFDLVDIAVSHLEIGKRYNLAHEIVLLPVTYVDEFVRASRNCKNDTIIPVLVLSPDSLIESANRFASRLGSSIRVASFSVISPAAIPELWQSIHRKLLPDHPYLDRELQFAHRIDVAPYLLPAAFLRRQFDNNDELPPPTNPEELELMTLSILRYHAVVAALARCEKAGMNPTEAEKVLDQFIREELLEVTVPVSVIAAGVAPGYTKQLYAIDKPRRGQDIGTFDNAVLWEDIVNFEDDNLIEMTALNFIGTHRAIARGGIAIVTSEVTPYLFNLLKNLERRYVEAKPTKRKHVWRWLKEIGRAAASLFDWSSLAVLKHASIINVFSSFPLGLAILPGDTAPLCCLAPIAYRSILPLTRALQTELSSRPMVFWGQSISVLIIECIGKGDRIGAYSRATWSFIEQTYKTNPSINVYFVSANSPSDIPTLLAQHKPDALILSAHGHYDTERNIAGIIVGTEFTIGDDLGNMPPLVLLSACHVSPRGTGAVNIADQLLREGATAVLGTLVPVDVRHNGILVNRFLTYLEAAQDNTVGHRTIADIWHHTATTNALNDIVFSNPGISEWAASFHKGQLVTELFTLERSVGRLRKNHVYEDTVTILREIAEETGDLTRFNSWIDSTGYIPESLFYCMIGWPEQIVLQDP